LLLLWWEVQHISAQQYTPSNAKGKKVNFITSKTNGYANDINLANSDSSVCAAMFIKKS
jgi:hypothetical protein